MATTIILTREDINNPLHPFLFQELLEQCNLPPDSEELHLRVSKVGNEWISNADPDDPNHRFYR